MFAKIVLYTLLLFVDSTSEESVQKITPDIGDVEDRRQQGILTTTLSEINVSEDILEPKDKVELEKLIVTKSVSGTNANSKTGGLEKAINKTDIRMKIPELLAQFCPGANACADARFNATDDEETNNKPSCCTACSCKNTCHTTHNCCFPSDETSTTDTTNCYSTLYPELDYSEQLGHISYKMVDTSSADCGNQNVAPWGSLYPVYSKSRRKIYKNSLCAMNDGVKDSVRFNAYVACARSVYAIHGAFFSDSFWKGSRKRCDVWFEFPGKISELQKHICYKKLIDTCQEEFVAIDYFIARDQIMAACSSGLLSPYRNKENVAYRNVFCAMCNEEYNQLMCPYLRPSERSTQNFITFLNDSAFETFQTPNRRHEVKQACLFEHGKKVDDTCRPVLCPKAQTRNTQGECKFTVNTWYNFPVSVFLHLSSERCFSTINLTKYDFISKWTRYWEINRIYYFPTNNTKEGFTTTVMVLLSRKFHSIKPQHLMSNVSSLEHEKWYVKTKDGTLALEGHFMDVKDRHINDRNYRETRNMTYIYSNKDVDHVHNFFIDDTTYCDQVYLKTGEFIINGTFLINNLTKNVIHYGGYYFPNLFDESSAMVCIDDSGLERVQSSSGYQTLMLMPYASVVSLCLIVGYF